jgi:hypothetical protein
VDERINLTVTFDRSLVWVAACFEFAMMGIVEEDRSRRTLCKSGEDPANYDWRCTTKPRKCHGGSLTTVCRSARALPNTRRRNCMMCMRVLAMCRVWFPAAMNSQRFEALISPTASAH